MRRPRRLRHNMRMRKVLIGVTAAAIAVAVIVIGAVGVDYGTSIYAEYRLSSTVRKAANLGSDPFVAIVAFPFIPQAMRDHYNQLEIKANAVDHAMVGKATARSHDVLGRPDLRVLADQARCEAAGGQAGEPHHHRLDAPGPVHGHHRPDG